MKSDNELIAEFMGYEVLDKYPRHNIGAPESGGRKYYLRDKMKFDISWDWLMPVVAKIFMLRHTEMRMSVGSLEIKSMPYKNGGLYFTISVCEPTLTGIQCYHKAVVEFIKWYNENKTTP